ncbi:MULTISPECIES: transaldolase family protein [Pantoea]|jgi:fructose-6-phosphate aldolase 1|uniref:transaldolase family protein n=1 Tax=Pantoea TaxID=53335 RepID=UPI0002E6E3C6|nr:MULTISPECIES: transaldolase family protein [Pantoea]AMB74786.1 fructose-6-phosphate aldolase [Pantoea ananatis]KNA29791.1 fructose-6-phosphate aldolase [Pantoea ananatis]MCH9269052.1 fructose-6-phosphate aldolase [Pantoea ananatis]MCS3404812.1 fructose-6-phosphate aldolase [Pantoea sp. B566]MCV3301073.1 fructose-6-phosphate aldolase [Pantoea ananatis]
MELYIDSADTLAIHDLVNVLPVNGVTTNPSLVAKSGVELTKLISELRTILGEEKLIFAQVLAKDTPTIIREAQYLHELCANMVVKIPVDRAGLAAITQLKQRNIPTLGTAIYSTSQAMLAAFAGADYIAPYFNRMENNNINAKQAVSDMQQFIQLHKMECKILAASFKNTTQVADCLLSGAAAVTLPVDVMCEMFNSPLAKHAIDDFSHDWHRAFNRLQLMI